jgi:hypothetical protein
VSNRLPGPGTLPLLWMAFCPVQFHTQFCQLWPALHSMQCEVSSRCLLGQRCIVEPSAVSPLRLANRHCPAKPGDSSSEAEVCFTRQYKDNTQPSHSVAALAGPILKPHLLLSASWLFSAGFRDGSAGGVCAAASRCRRKLMTVFLGCFGGSSPLPLGRSPRCEPCTLPRCRLPPAPPAPPPPPPSSIEARHEMGSLALAEPSAAASRCCVDALDHAAARWTLNACLAGAAAGPLLLRRATSCCNACCWRVVLTAARCMHAALMLLLR